MYQALYRKYRPQTFDDVVGQESITQVLKAQLISGKLSHAYLFTGSRGTGKTTCSKILAKAVNCLHTVDGNPCNRCAACRSIDDGSCMDVLEIDAASNNGVDNVRTLREDAIYAPAEVKKRVYIIDEVHMLSMSAFNALLKIIEEPPPHLMFILATTELHKVPATILSRCQRFAFRRILPQDITARIGYVAYEEGIDLDPDAARLLGRLADGALRDGLSLLDQCAAAADETLTVDTVYSCLGIAGARKAAELLEAAAAHDTRRALTILSEQYAEGKEIAAMTDELLSLSRDLLILKTAPAAGRDMLTGVCTDEELSRLLPRFSAGELLRLTTLLQQTAAGYAKSSNRRMDAELCLIQMCDPSLNLDAEALNARLSRLEEALASGAVTLTPGTGAPTSGTGAPGEPAAPQEPAAGQEPASDQEPKDAEAQPPQPSEPVSDQLPVGFWADLVTGVKPVLSGSAGGFFTTSENGMLRPALRGDLLEITAASEFVKGAVDDEATRRILAGKASALLKRPVRVRFVLQDSRPDKENDPMQELIRLGRTRPDLIHVHSSKL